MTTLKDIQQAVAAANLAVTEKGYSKPNCEAQFAGFDERVWVHVKATNPEAASHVIGLDIRDYFSGDSFEEALADAMTFIGNLPDPLEHKRQDAVKSLGITIDKCRDAGFEVDFLNPLTEAMRKLSENILVAA